MLEGIELKELVISAKVPYSLTKDDWKDHFNN